MSALDKLRHYAKLAFSGKHSPEQAEEGRWSGIAFRVAESLLVAEMGEVMEIIDPPHCSRVPGTQSWFLGLANMRGNLLPVTDLHGFVVQGRAASSRNSRLLVHHVQGSYMGFKVDDILGMKQFSEMDASSENVDVPDTLKPYVERCFKQQGQIWPVFSIQKFVTSRDFLHIAK